MIKTDKDNYSDEIRAALVRDQYACAKCACKINLVVHHIDMSRKKNLVLNNDLDNLITLCKSCHAEAHGMKTRFTKPTIEIILEMKPHNTYQEIGDYLGISRQRVHQIISKYKKDNPTE
jgi:5-methylcytosine-specific restriction endonuclease McrA